MRVACQYKVYTYIANMMNPSNFKTVLFEARAVSFLIIKFIITLCCFSVTEWYGERIQGFKIDYAKISKDNFN